MERELRPAIERFQRSALYPRQVFMPVDKVGYVARTAAMRVISNPLVSRIVGAAMR